MALRIWKWSKFTAKRKMGKQGQYGLFCCLYQTIQKKARDCGKGKRFRRHWYCSDIIININRLQFCMHEYPFRQHSVCRNLQMHYAIVEEMKFHVIGYLEVAILTRVM